MSPRSICGTPQIYRARPPSGLVVYRLLSPQPMEGCGDRPTAIVYEHPNR
jgi:hypothetical protein